MKKPKYIFIVGGVISGVGKGIASSSIGKILQDRGLKVTAIKIDPYINVDAGTMNPTEHGEVFVLSDGYETDQDMGNYERFLDVTLTETNYMTTGSIYKSVIEKERNLEYGGKCVEVVPHVPLEIIDRIKKAGTDADADIVIIEIGGTVGEYQNVLFLEAARMLKIKNPKDVLFTLVSYLPIPSKVGEMKTKPTQYAVRTLNASGIQPDIIIARAEHALDEKRKEKLSFSCNVSIDRIISAPDVSSVYDVPLNFEKEGLSDLICGILEQKCTRGKNTHLADWKKFTNTVHRTKDEVRIAVIGKYFDTGNYVLSDAYLSVIEALKYSAYGLKKKPVIEWFNAVDFEKDTKQLKELSKFDGILIPGGFGARGVEGKIKVIQYARQRKIPLFGICYGMQLIVVEYARNVLKHSEATSREINPNSPHLVIDVMEGQRETIKQKRFGGSMRLGSYPAVIKRGTIAHKAYGKENIIERHRHRYEVSNQYVPKLEKAGLIFSGTSPDNKLMEIAELPKSAHPFFLGTQFHPEFLSRPLSPHKLFTEFIKASISHKK